jgi:hypothetical protein
LQYFWGLHPAHDLEFGYHYVRIRLAELLVHGYDTGKFAKGTIGDGDSDTASDEDGGGRPVEAEPFANWTRQQWIVLLEDLKETVELAFRRDTTVELADLEDDKLEDKTPTPFPEWLEEEALLPLKDAISICAVLAPIRTELEAVANGAATGLQDESILNEIAYVAS